MTILECWEGMQINSSVDEVFQNQEQNRIQLGYNFMSSDKSFFPIKSSTHLFHNLVEEKSSDEQETENPPVGVCMGIERQQVVIVRNTAHTSHSPHQTRGTHTLTTQNHESNKPCCGVSSSRVTDRGDPRAAWEAVQVILVPGGRLGGTVRWDDTE